MDTITEPLDTSTPSGASTPEPPTAGQLNLQTVGRPVSPRRRRAAMAAIAAVLAAVTLLAVAGGDPTVTHTANPLVEPDVRGVYRFATGEELTLLGTQARPRYELGAIEVELVADDPDRFSARDNATERIDIQRSDGRVTGLVHHRPDGSAASAERTESFTEHDVAFSAPGAELAGTLFVPTTPGPHPAVVIIHGAERATRETYRLLATHYAREGVAALIYDKRGLGASTGDVASATFDDLTGDALAGVEMLRAHPDIDPRRVGVAGFSQGAWLAALAADRDADVAFVVAYSASGFSPADQNAWLYGNLLATRGIDVRTIGIADRVARMLYSTVDLVDAGVMPAIPQVPGFWFHALDLHLDTAALWERVDQPVLGIWGANDCQVPAHDSARMIADALERAGNTNHTLTVVANADHGLTIASPCEHELGLHHHGRMEYAPEYLVSGAAWIHELDRGSSDVTIAIPDDTRNPDLDWHQPTPEPAPWHTTAAVQIPAMLIIPIASTAVAVGAGVQRRRRRRDDVAVDRTSRATARTRAGLILTGFTTVAVGASALVEIATLGDLYSRLLVGNGPVAGTTPLLLAAGLAAMTTTAFSGIFTAQLLASRRRDDAGAATRLDWCVLGLGTAIVLWAWAWQFPLTALASLG